MMPPVRYQPITLASPRSSTDSVDSFDSFDIMGSTMEESTHQPGPKPYSARWRRLRSTFSFRVKILLGGLAIVLVLLVILIPYFTVSFRKSGVVDLGYARYQGQKLQGGITQTLGIRYAAPPVGELRFAAPQDPIPNPKRVQAGNKHGNRCMGTGVPRVAVGTSEDCLFLDVFAPSNVTADSRLPVFFWIQGGGFNANTNPNYNGAGLIQASDYNIVVVTLNYRVGPYGFLASQEVESEASLNNGLKDQIKALQWVQKHIEKFGGDPDHVVIGGDSAGAASVTLLMAAYGGRNDGLFHAAAAESQSFAAVLNVTESQFMYDALVARTKCSHNPTFPNRTLACLRSLTAAQLQRSNIGIPFPGAPAKPLFPYNPTLDHDLIPDLTVALFRSGRYIRVPSVFGDVTNEGTIFTPRNASTRADVARFLHAQFPALTTNQTATLSNMYPDTGPRFPFAGSYWRPLSDAYGELRYTCPGLFLSRTLAADNRTARSTWNYRYDVQDPRQQARGLGVPHVSDVYAIWGPTNTHGGAPPSLTGKNANIVPVIQGYWTSFIRSFDPNTYRVPGSPRWELFTVPEQGRILFQTNQTRMESVSPAQRHRCSYMDSIALSIQQ